MIRESVSLEKTIDLLNDWIEQDRKKALAVLDRGGLDFLNRLFGPDEVTGAVALTYARKKGFLARPIRTCEVDQKAYVDRRGHDRMYNGATAPEYTLDEKRVAQYLVELTGIGGGGDPVGFLIASHASLGQLREGQL